MNPQCCNLCNHCSVCDVIIKGMLFEGTCTGAPGHAIQDINTGGKYCDYYDPMYDDDEYERRKNNYI